MVRHGPMGSCRHCRLTYRWAGNPPPDRAYCRNCLRPLTDDHLKHSTSVRRRPLSALAVKRGREGPRGAPIVGGIRLGDPSPVAILGEDEPGRPEPAKEKEDAVAKKKKGEREGREAWARQGLSAAQKEIVRRGVAAFSKALSERISAAGLTIKDLSAALGFKSHAVQNWTRPAAQSLPSLREVFLMAHELGCEPADLVRPVSLATLRGEPEPEPEKPTGNGVVDRLAGRVADRLEEKVQARAMEILASRLGD